MTFWIALLGAAIITAGFHFGVWVHGRIDARQPKRHPMTLAEAAAEISRFASGILPDGEWTIAILPRGRMPCKVCHGEGCPDCGRPIESRK